MSMEVSKLNLTLSRLFCLGLSGFLSCPYLCLSFVRLLVFSDGLVLVVLGGDWLSVVGLLLGVVVASSDISLGDFGFAFSDIFFEPFSIILEMARESQGPTEGALLHGALCPGSETLRSAPVVSVRREPCRGYRPRGIVELGTLF